MAAQRIRQSPEPSRLDLSSIRLLKVPEVAPPFDGEALPPVPEPQPQPVAAVASDGPPWDSGGTPPPAEHQHASASADSAADCGWTRQFAQLLVESLAGVRPVRQLLPWLSGNAPVQLRRIAPVFGRGARPRVLRVLAGWPTNDVAELTIIVRLGPRTHALAARLEAAHPGDGRPEEAQPTRWLCTDLEAA